VSFLVHAALIALMLMPVATGTLERMELIEQGAGGPGPAGGGGGGTRGTGGDPFRERVRYIPVARPAPAAQTAVETVVPPPPPVVEPVLPPQPVPQPVPQPTQPTVAAAAAAAAPIPGAAVTGTGGGSGNDGSAGQGPGSGGGIGSGIGTGRGSGVGPGTGGGTAQANYPPTPTEMFLPPLPAPSRVKGFTLIATFEVDERGRVIRMDFTRTPDRGYNNRLEEVLKNTRFRPGTTPDGTPIRATVQLTYVF
jgi:periplasmic protein TonB